MKGADVLAESPPDIPDCVIPGGASVAKAVAAPAVPIAGDAADQIGVTLMGVAGVPIGLAVLAKLPLPAVDLVNLTEQLFMLVPTGPVRTMLATLLPMPIVSLPESTLLMLVANWVAVKGDTLAVVPERMLLEVRAQLPLLVMAMLLSRVLVKLLAGHI